MSKTGLCSMGGLLMAVGTLMCTEDQVAPFFPTTARVVSDDFNACALSPEVWEVTDAAGGAEINLEATGTEDARALIRIPAAGQSDAAGGEVRLLQAVNDGDFDVEVKFDSSIDRPGLRQGVLIQQDPSHVLRYELSGEPIGVVLRSSTVVDVTSSVHQEEVVASSSPMWLRIQHQGDQWTLQYSYSGETWSDHAIFPDPMTFSAIGVVAANQAGQGEPPFEAKVDYFLSAADPFEAGEDAAPSDATALTRSVTGGGTIVVVPDRAGYYCGETVLITAQPDTGWVFSGWQGDLSGSQASQNLAMDQSRAIGALFVPAGDKVPAGDITKPVIAPVKDHSALAGGWYRIPMSLVEGTTPVVWSLVEAPDGMTISADSGEIVWPDPQSAGQTHSVSIMAANNAGEARATYRVKVMDVTLTEATLSSAFAADGARLLARYHVSGPAGLEVKLGCRIIGPDGSRGPDSSEAGVLTLTADDAWYTREFLVNAPPPPALGSYDLEWEARWGENATVTLKSPGALSILPPVPTRIPILMYHYLGEQAYSPYWVTPARFRDQMRALKAYGYTAMLFPEWMEVRAGEASLPDKPVLITFDDGHRSIYTRAWPVLSDPSINLKATVFLISGLMGTGDPPDELLTWDQAIELQKSGVFDMQSHTATHPPIPPLAGAQLASELLNSRRDIEYALGKPVLFLCWPYGDLDPEAKRTAWEAGYWGALGVTPGIEETGESKWTLREVLIDWNSSLEYAPDHPETFFLNQIGEPNLVIPDITVDELSARDPANPDTLVTSVPRGGTVTLRAVGYNAGQPSTVMASLVLDLDTDPGNGSSYDTRSNGQDIEREFPDDWAEFEWSWKAPADAPAGLYYGRVVFRDTRDVVVWKTSASVPVFEIAEK